MSPEHVMTGCCSGVCMAHMACMVQLGTLCLDWLHDDFLWKQLLVSLQELRSTRLERQELHDHLQTANASSTAAEEQLEVLKAQLETAKQATADAQQQQQDINAQLQSTEEYAMSLKEELQRKQDEVGGNHCC